MDFRNCRAALLALIVAAVVGGRAGAQDTAPAAPAFAESEALAEARQWASCVSQADASGLDTLLHDRYVHIHATALVESKAQFLEAFRNGWRRYDPISLDEVTVRVFGNAAVVAGKFNLKAFVRGKTLEGVNRFSLVLVKTQEGERVVSFQATPIPQQK